jgi:Carboxypeptidase regulatory-like domain
MVSGLKLAHKIIPKQMLRFGAPLLVVALVGNLVMVDSHAAKCDIISAVSTKIYKIATTTTSASITWNDGHTNGDRYFCYGITPPKTCPVPAASRKTTRVEVMNNLIPQTKYYYRFYGTWGSKTSNTIGAFITDASTCNEPTQNLIVGQVGDGNGNPLEHVIITLSKTAGGEAVEIDTSLSTGGYTIRIVTPGSYFLNYSYSTFPAPAPEAITLEASNKWPGMKRLAGFYQVGGTVVVPPKDSVKGAIVTLVSTTNPSITYTTETDFDGHYNFPAKPGSYTLTASYMGSKLPSPLPVTIATSSVKVAPMVLSGTTGTIQKAKLNTKGIANSIVGLKKYRIDGVRLEKKSRQIKALP